MIEKRQSARKRPANGCRRIAADNVDRKTIHRLCEGCPLKSLAYSAEL